MTSVVGLRREVEARELGRVDEGGDACDPPVEHGDDRTDTPVSSSRETTPGRPSTTARSARAVLAANCARVSAAREN
jgi:hypothetical protein